VIRSNPTIGTALPARDEQRAIEDGEHDDEEVKALSTEELATFLRVCPEQWRTFFCLLAATGLRVSEAFALRWRDLSLGGSAPQVRVRRAYVRGRFGPPKTRHGKRAVPIDHALVMELRSGRGTAELSSDDDLVFPAANGMPLRQENVRRRVLGPTAEEAGVHWAGFHAFRHTCATRLFAQGRNAVQVQRWLGHHSPAFTLSVYVHLLDGDLGGALDSAPRNASEVAPETSRSSDNATTAVGGGLSPSFDF
jgi:integrase